ncbi:MAG: HU family DNA-binding protein [Pseudomonadota bacterium]
MTKAELIDVLYKNLSKNKGLSKVLINEIVDSTFTELGKGLKKTKRFTYPGFGTWTVKRRKARTGRNPQTGDKIKIKARNTVTFKPSSTYKEKL